MNDKETVADKTAKLNALHDAKQRALDAMASDQTYRALFAYHNLVEQIKALRSTLPPLRVVT